MLLGKADKLRKSLGVFDGHVREDLAIKADIGLFEGVDESAIGHPLGAHCRADAGDPELPEVPLPVMTSPEETAQSGRSCLPIGRT